MKLIVDMKIRCEAPTDKHVCAMVGKEIETDLVPAVGMELEDPVWKKPRPIERVTVNPTEGSYYLYVGDDTAENRDRCEQLKQLYHRNGWTRLRR